MRIEQLALTTYTVRDFCKTPAEIAATLKRLRQIGYRAVQVSGMGPIAEEELKKMLDGEGLVCCATHEPAQTILDQPERVADRLHKLGCLATAYPHPAGVKLETAADVKALAARLNKAGEALHKAGIKLTYHNHQIEFRQFDDAENGRRTMLDLLYAATDPDYLQGEIDTYWVQFGGGDPVTWCQRLVGRLPLLHLKDYAINEKNQPTFAEIGHGTLDWRRIIPTAEKSGCQWFIVEQDTCPGDPFDSLQLSFEFVRDHLVG